MNSPLMNKLFIFILLIFGVFSLVRFSFVLLGLLMPFVIGFFIAIIANPLKKRLSKLGFPGALASLTSIILIFASLILLIYMIFNLARAGISFAGSYIDLMVEFFSTSFKDIYYNLQSHYPNLITKSFEGFLLDIQDGGLLSLKEFDFGGKIFTAARILPSSLIFLIFTLMSSYYLSSDYDKFMDYLKEKLDKYRWSQNIIVDFNKSVNIGLRSWLKAQLVIMGISLVLSIFLFILIRVPYPIPLGLGLALFDALPLFGSGAVLWPMSLYYLLTQNFLKSFLTILLYVIIVAVRQIVEPRLIGQQIGINPLITLLTIYLGFKLLGVTGIILGVIILVIATSIINGKSFKSQEEIKEG